MYAVKAIYDGNSVKLLEPAPFSNACEVMITFPEPAASLRSRAVIPPGEEDDPFYSESNLRALQESIAQLERGEVVVKTLDELLEMSK